MADSVVEVAAAPMAAEVEEEVEAVGGADAPEDDAADEITNLSGDHKRKLEDLEPRDDEEEAPLKKQEVSAETPALVADKSDADGLGDGSGIHSTETLVAVAEEVKSNNVESAEPKIEGSGAFDVKVGAQEPHPTVEINDSVGADTEKELQISETPTVGNDQISPGQNAQSTTVLPADSSAMSRKIEVPNNKVGVLIGKAGETIKYLQFNSGTKIQIMRDAEADPHSSTRLVELIGTLESINKAEKLIKDVIAEADAGGSPSLVARGFSTLQSGGEQFEIRVPNEKVGLIIGKGGETIKILQTRSGARIQLIPQHLLEGDASKERTVRITGDKKQIVSAKEMIKEVMNQVPIRPSPLSGYSRQNYRPRGPSAMPHWGSRARAPAQPTMGYEYQQRGTYPPPQMSQYPQPYGSYTQQPAPRGSYSSAGWEERAVAPVHSTPTGRYDYYGQGSLASGTPASMSNPIPGTTPAPVSYGQSQAPNYGHPSPYGQPVPAQQNYGQGYNDPRYDSCLPNQQLNGQQTMASQPGVYGQGTAPQSGFSQQHSYTKPGYGVPPQEGLPSYGVPSKASQPGDTTYQGLALSSYGSGTMTQKYPFGSNAPSQPAPSYNQTYGPASGAMDGYTQPPSAAYNQYGGQSATPGYVQGGQPVPAPAYAQPSSQPAGYGQYTSSQQGYGDPGSSNVNYGYHGEFAGAAYGNTFPGSGHGAPPAGGNQLGHAQQPLNLAGYYDQTAIAQTGYGSHPGNAPN